MESHEEYRGPRRVWRELCERAVHQLHPEPRVPPAVCRCADEPGDGGSENHAGEWLRHPAGGGQLLGEQELPVALRAGVEPRYPADAAYEYRVERRLERGEGHE